MTTNIRMPEEAEFYEADTISKRLQEGAEKCFSLDELEESIQQQIREQSPR